MFRLKKLTYEQIFLAIVVLIVCIVRLRHANIPLERDEGEYAYAAWSILHGGVPYLDFYNMKLPGVYFAYALIYKVLGEQLWTVRIFVLAMSLGSAYFLYFLARQLVPSASAVVVVGCYLLMSIGYFAQGFISNTEHFVVFFMLAAIAAMARWSNIWGAILGGFLLGISLLMKQHAMYFGLFGGIWLIWRGFSDQAWQKNWPMLFVKCAAFGVSYLIPIGVVVLYSYQAGAIDGFVFYIFKYAAAYTSLQGPEWRQLRYYFSSIFIDNMGFWAVFWGGIVVAFRTTWRQDKIWLWLFFACSFAAITPGWYLRQHYYQMLFPAAAMIIGWIFGLIASSRRWSRYKVGLLWLCLLLTVTRHVEYFFTKSSDTVMHQKYTDTYFAETVQIGDWLNKNSRPEDKIGMYGNEPQLWFYAKRKAASNFLYLYPLLENQPFAASMTAQYIAQNEAAKPRFFVMADYPNEDIRNPETQQLLNDWSRRFLQNYRLRGVMYESARQDYGEWIPEATVIDSSRILLLSVYERI